MDPTPSDSGSGLEVTFDTNDRFSGGSFRAARTKQPGITWDTWVVLAEEAGEKG